MPPTAVDLAVRALATARHDSTTRRGECQHYHELVLEEAHRALAGQHARRAATRTLMVDASHAAEWAREADAALEKQVNSLVTSALRAVREASARQTLMDRREHEMRAEWARLDASKAALEGERLRMAAERSGSQQAEERLRADMKHRDEGNYVEWKAVRGAYGNTIHELEVDLERQCRSERTMRAALEAEIASLNADHLGEVLAERESYARNEAEMAGEARRSRSLGDARRAATAMCLVSEVTNLEAEKAALAADLHGRITRLRERNRQLEESHRTAMATAMAARKAMETQLKEENGRIRKHLTLALDTLPRGNARQLLFYESLKSMRERPTSMSWRGTDETLNKADDIYNSLEDGKAAAANVEDAKVALIPPTAPSVVTPAWPIVAARALLDARATDPGRAQAPAVSAPDTATPSAAHGYRW